MQTYQVHIVLISILVTAACSHRISLRRVPRLLPKTEGNLRAHAVSKDV